jgi:hypothetical protein
MFFCLGDESGGDHYSATMREILGPMASGYNHLVFMV